MMFRVLTSENIKSFSGFRFAMKFSKAKISLPFGASPKTAGLFHWVD
jgi:hypothetical protein